MMRAKGLFVLSALLVCGAAAVADAPSSNRSAIKERYRRPASIPFPETDPYSANKVELGRALFFDPVFSRSQTMACVSCHEPSLSWGDGLGRAVGEAGSTLRFQSPTLLNVAWLERFGWDGKFRDLESVAFAAITGKANMNLPAGTLVERLEANPIYTAAFAGAFGTPGISQGRVEQALATYERTIVSPPAPFDKWIGGDERAISEPAKRGFDLFNGKGRCAECHSGWSFTDGSFHDIGTAEDADIGRGKYFATSRKLKYAFKTPTLRDVAVRAPFMHGGSVPTLPDVIALYDRGGIARPSRAEVIAPLHLSDGEKNDLIAFLQTLTSRPNAPGGNPISD